MIIYFSATGNCRHTAELLAQKTEDTAVSILELINNGETADLKNEKRPGLAVPAYSYYKQKHPSGNRRV